VKVQCALCREIVAFDFRLAGEGTIEVHCGACGGSFSVAATRTTTATTATAPATTATAPATPAPAEPPPAATAATVRIPLAAAEGQHCPKCGAAVSGDACRGCGLLASRFDEFRASDDAAADPPVVAAWEQALAAWDEPARHDRFVELASEKGAYAYAARRYRERLRADPDDAVARGRLDRITRMAEAALLATAHARKLAGTKEPYRGSVLVLVLLLVGIAIGGIYAMTRHKSTTAVQDGRRTPVPPVHAAPRHTTPPH
jgi:hypothetical protein